MTAHSTPVDQDEGYALSTLGECSATTAMVYAAVDRLSRELNEVKDELKDVKEEVVRLKAIVTSNQGTNPA